jgi:hypothetical protein
MEGKYKREHGGHRRNLQVLLKLTLVYAQGRTW